MNSQLLSAELKLVFDADAALVAAGLLRLYRDEAPERTELPYAVASVGEVQRTSRTSHSEYHTTPVTFEVYAETDDLAGRLLDLVVDAYRRWVPCSLAGGGAVLLLQQENDVTTVIDRNIRMASVRYSLMTKSPRLRPPGFTF
jgi:hypothetical protein